MNKGSLARKVTLAFVAALTAFVGLAPFAPSASAAANYTQVRYDGEDRFETASLIADAIAEATPTAVLARADIYPDALTGAYAAASNDDAPMLLTRNDSVPGTTMDALEARGVDTVVLLGGFEAINTSVENQLEDAGYNVERISGANRYRTAIQIAENGDIVGEIQGERSALVSSGQNFPDALSGAPLSFAAFLPSLLVPSDLDGPASDMEVLQATIDALQRLDVEQVYMIGGPAAVDEAVENELVDAGFGVERLAGENRGATSVEVFEFGMEQGIYTNGRFGIARGDTFPDALAYAPLAGRSRPTIAPESGAADTGGSSNGLLLANGTCDLSDAVETFIAANSDTWTEGEILGGPEAICPELEDLIADLATAGLVNITLDSNQTTPGGTITGNVQGEDIESVFVSGCGLDEEEVVLDENGDFTLTIPTTQTTDCTLVFTTTFTDGRTETDTFQIDVQSAGEPNITLNPSSGPSGSNVTATYSGARPARITDVSSNNCTITNEGTQTQNRTFTISGTDGTACTVVTTVEFTDTEGGTRTFQDTFTIGPPGPGVQQATATSRPELVSAQVVDTTTQPGPNGVSGNDDDFQQTRVRFVFDEPVQGSTLATGFANFNLVENDPNVRYIGQRVTADPSDPNAVIVTFGAEGALNTGAGETNVGASELSNITLATVDFGAVVDNQGQQNPEGDAPLAGAGTTNPGSQAGTTAAPDLLNVQNFRGDPDTTVGDTLVDFTFDEAAFTVDPNGFHIILLEGAPASDLTCTAVAGSAGGFSQTTGTQTITVSCPTTVTLTAESMARGYVEPATVSDNVDDRSAPGGNQDCGPSTGTPAETVNGTCVGNVNPMQASEQPDNPSGTPDLDSAQLRPATDTASPDAVLYDFDEAVLVPNQTPGQSGVANTSFCVYTAGPSGTSGVVNRTCSSSAQRSTVDPSQVLATFGAGSFVDQAVGAFVLEGAVVEQDGGRVNQEDEEGVTNQGTTATTAGRTIGPDLTAVRLEVSSRDPFTDAPSSYRAVYTFDEALSPTNTALGTEEKFRLFLADGTGLIATNCSTGTATGANATGNDTVVCTTFAAFSDPNPNPRAQPTPGTEATVGQVGSAVAGTVDNAAVSDGTNQNPEGYEVTTGGTGTPV